jgi:hypothetical protein
MGSFNLHFGVISQIGLVARNRATIITDYLYDMDFRKNRPNALAIFYILATVS